MIYDRRDFEVLRLYGFCRYIPTELWKKYDSPYFLTRYIYTLQKRGLIKLQRTNRSHKLTPEGKTVLAEMGYTYPEDVRLNIGRPVYERRLKNALCNITLFLAGIDIYSDSMRTLAGKDVGYISSLVLRTDDNMKALAGTRFLGILKIRDIVYVTYHVESKNDWIVPGYEREIFFNEITQLSKPREIQLILFGNSVEELWDVISPERQSEKLPRGMRCFDRALEELGSEYLLVPQNQSGVLQLSVLKIRSYRQRLAAAIGCTPETRSDMNECDGTINGVPYIIAIDMNIKRIIRAIYQIKKHDSTLVPQICCFSFQKEVILKMLKRYNLENCAAVSINMKSMKDVFPEINTEVNMSEPHVTKEGRYVDATERKVKKSDIEVSET